MGIQVQQMFCVFCSARCKFTGFDGHTCDHSHALTQSTPPLPPPTSPSQSMPAGQDISLQVPLAIAEEALGTGNEGQAVHSQADARIADLERTAFASTSVLLARAASRPALPTYEFIPRKLKPRYGDIMRDLLNGHVDAERNIVRRSAQARATAVEAGQLLWVATSLLLRRPLAPSTLSHQ